MPRATCGRGVTASPRRGRPSTLVRAPPMVPRTFSHAPTAAAPPRRLPRGGCHRFAAPAPSQRLPPLPRAVSIAVAATVPLRRRRLVR